MSEIVKMAALTMSSTDLLGMVNAARRKFGEAEVRRNDFVARCKDELEGEHYETFVVTNPNGTESEGVNMTRDQCMYVLMRESKAVRRSVAERLKAIESPAIPQTLPEALRLAAEAIEERDRLALENKAKDEALAEAAPKVRALDRIASPTDGAVGLRIAAKLLQMPEKQFLQFANAEGYIFRNHHSRVWQGYADKAKAGLVEQKFTTVEREDGSTKVVEQVLITRLGVAKLAEKLERRSQCAAMIATGSTAGQSKHSTMQP